MKNIVTANGELNRWCGTENINYYEGDTALGFLFKYAVPKVIYLKGYGHPFTVSIISGWGDTSGDYGVEIANPTLWKKGHSTSRYVLEFSQDPALALFWALYKVMEAKE